MTREEIEKLDGPELSEAIAREVMGWVDPYDNSVWWEDRDGILAYKCNDWHPPTCMNQCMQVVEKLIKEGGCPALIYDDRGNWALAMDGMQNIPSGDEPADIETTFFVEKDLWCKDPRIAILRAALKAVRGEE